MEVTRRAAAAGIAAPLVVGSAVEGRDGGIGTLVGTRWGGPPDHAPYLLVRVPWLRNVRRTVRLVPLQWVVVPGTAGTGTGSPLILDADRRMVLGCQPVRPDADLRADVADALAADSRLRPMRLTRLSRIRSAVAEGTVTLTGYVPNDSYRREARARATGVRGILGVTDELVADERVTGDVAQALVAEAATRGAHLTVASRLGQVTLGGALPSLDAQARATALAAAVRGVAGVQNSTTLAPAPAPSGPRPA